MHNLISNAQNLRNLREQNSGVSSPEVESLVATAANQLEEALRIQISAIAEHEQVRSDSSRGLAGLPGLVDFPSPPAAPADRKSVV